MSNDKMIYNLLKLGLYVTVLSFIFNEIIIPAILVAVVWIIFYIVVPKK